jgi:hypothetical protein
MGNTPDKAAIRETIKEMFGLAEASGQKHDATGTPTSTGYIHGPGGLLSWPGVDPDVFSTVAGNIGILNEIPFTPNRYMDPTFSTITGVKAETGSEPEEVCDDPPQAGDLKSCVLTAPFGRYERATVELELDRLGQLNDRSDPMDLRLVNSPIGSNPFGPNASMQTPADILSNELSQRIFSRNVAFARLLARQLWVGDPANNSAGGGYREMRGITGLVRTGFRDALTGVLCPSLDSDIKDFGGNRIDDNPQAIVAMLSYMLYTRKDAAMRQGLDPVRFLYVMRPETFWELSAVWPCAYLTYRCQLTGAAEQSINPADAINMRDSMRSGKYLIIDGERIEVRLDDGIPAVEQGDGCFSSDIFLLPMSVSGGARSVLYGNYFEYNNPAVNDALGSGMVLGRIEGAFLSWPRQTNQCFVLSAKIEPRVILRTPWLAGRLDNVVACPVQRTLSPFPGDDYFKNGGNSSIPWPYDYATTQKESGYRNPQGGYTTVG